METLWRWTFPSVFLLLALNIGRILSQSVSPNYPFQLPGEPICDCNPRLVQPQLQLKNVISYPPNGLAPGGPVGLVPECRKPSCQDGFSTQNLPINQQTNYVPISPTPCANLGSINAQGPTCAGPSEPAYYIPGPSLPFSLPIPQQSQCQSQEISRLPPFKILPPPQGILQCPSLVGPPFTPLIPELAPGIGLSGSALCQQNNISPFANSAILGSPFTPLIPIVNLGAPPPCIDVLPSQGTLPLPRSQGSVSIHPPDSPLLSFNYQEFPGASIDVFPFAQCPSAFNGPPMNTFRPPNLGSIPQGLLGPQCVTLPETQPRLSATTYSSIDPPSQNCCPYSQFNMFQVPKTTLFPNVAPAQESLALPCDPTCSQGSGGANPGNNQQELICPQIPCSRSQNVPTLPLTSVFQPPVLPLNSGHFPWITDKASINFSPSQIKPQLCSISPNGFEPTLPQNAYPFDCPPINTVAYPHRSNQISSLPPVLPQSVYIPSYENPYKSTMADTAPIPITLQINVPAPSIPAPRITIINAAPEPSTAVSSTVDEFSYFDMPPLIIEGRKSRSRSWLPLILVALFAGDGNFGGNGGGCSYADGPIPIPYPIPIPTNNPVIVNK